MRLSAAWRALPRLLLLGLLAGCVTSGGQTKVIYHTAPEVAPEDRARLKPAFAVHALDEGRSIEFLGEITKLSMARLGEVLAANPAAKSLILTSPGGSVSAVSDLLPTLAARHLTTLVPLACDSACTLLFLQGETRLLGPHGRLGFHRSYLSVAPEASRADSPANKQMREILEHAGAPDAFISRVLATPPDSLWYPTPAELVAAHLVTDAAPATPAIVTSLGSEMALVDWVELNSPLERAFGQAFPQRFAALRQKVYDAFLAAAADGEARSELINDAIMAGYDEALPLSGDAALVAIFRIFLEMLAEAETGDPRICTRLASDGIVASAFAGAAATRYGDRLQDAAALVFLSYARDAAGAPSREAAIEAIDRFVKRLVRQEVLTDAQIQALRNPAGQPRTWCTANRAFLQAALDEGQGGGALVLRGMLYK